MAEKYIVSGTLRHGVHLDELDGDGRRKARIDVYRDGETFESDDEKLVAKLRRDKVLLTPEEHAAAAAAEGNPGPQRALAAQRQSLEDENARLRAELEAFKATQSPAPADKSTSGKAAAETKPEAK